MQITIEVKESVLDKVLWMLKHFESDVKIVDDDSIDVEHCLETLAKVRDGKLSDFREIDDVDLYIKELINATH